MTVLSLVDFADDQDAPPLYDGPPFAWPAMHRDALLPRVTRYVPFTPHPYQSVFLCSAALEAFLGGAAGPGKSSGMLMAALQFVDVPGYAALILRKTYKHLSNPGALIPKAAEWLAGTDARWSQVDHTWHFPAGATLTFGYARDLAQARAYQSAEFQFIGIDESTDIGEAVYRFLFTRLRAADHAGASSDGITLADVPLRMRPASNPGGPGHAWHKARFVDDDTRPPGVLYLPGRLEDNPSLRADEYERSLRVQDPVNWRRYRFGDWEVRNPGQVFDRTKIPVVEAPWPASRTITVCRFWDLASTEVEEGNDPDWTVGVRVARDTVSGREQVQNMVALRGSAAEVERVMTATARADGVEVVQVVEQEPGAAGKAYVSHIRRHVMAGSRVEAQPGSGAKELRIRVLIPVVENSELEIVRGSWNTMFLDEMDAYQGEGTTAHDDVPDATSGAHLWLTGARARVLV